MTDDAQAWVQLGAQAAEALTWFALTVWSLTRVRTHAWARLSAVGGVLLLVPAGTLIAARAQVLVAGDFTILQNYAASPLPTTYAVVRVVAALLLLAAVLAGRGTGRPSTA